MRQPLSSPAGPSAAHARTHRPGQLAQLLAPLCPPVVRVGSRRWFLQTGVAGLAGLGSMNLLYASKTAAAAVAPAPTRKSVILIWLSGGPSQLDMWDPKPEAPSEIRGPYRTIGTRLPGVRFCEHLPLQAQLADKLTIIRSVDCSASNHTPITFQAGNALARRTDDGRDGGGYPSMGSVAARFRGPNDPDLPGFVGLSEAWASDIWGAGHLGSTFEPVKGHELPGRLTAPAGIELPRLGNRDALRRQLDRIKQTLDRGPTMALFDRYQQQAYDMVVAGKVQQAFDLSQESDGTREAYGRDSLGEKALLARRLVEAGVTFVVLSGAWGIFDHHGDEVRWGGIQKGLTPLLPSVDRVLAALVRDLESRGLWEQTLVLMLGEFGRTPVMTPTAGRGHWTNVMSLLATGGGLPHGQVIGSTDRKGYDIVERPVRPADLSASVFRHLGIDLGAHWINPQGRPVPIVTEGGQPLAEWLS